MKAGGKYANANEILPWLMIGVKKTLKVLQLNAAT
jgi:hypothetical protein